MDKMRSLFVSTVFLSSISQSINQSINQSIYYSFIKSTQVSRNLLDTAEIHNVHAMSMHMSQWQRIHKYNMRNVHSQCKINTIISQLILSIKSLHTMGCTILRGKKNLLHLPPLPPSVLWHHTVQ